MNKILEKINQWGIPILIIGLPLYLIRLNIFGIPSTLLEILFLIVFGVWFVTNIKNLREGLKNKFNSRFKIQDSKFSSYPFSVFILLFVLASFFGLIVSNFSNSALGIYKAYFIEAVLFYVIAFNYFKYQKNRESVFLSLFASALAISFYAVFQRIIGAYWTGGVNELRISSVFKYPNALGLYLGPITVLSYFYFVNLIKNGWPIFKKDKFVVFFAALTFFISFYSIYLAKSEAALGAVIISIFFGSMFISKKFTFSFILVGVLAGAVIFSNNNLSSFVLEKMQLKDFSGEVRKQQWRETELSLKNNYNYISGCGLSGYQKCVKEFHQEGLFFNSEGDSNFRRKIVIFDEKYKSEHWRPVEIYMYPHNIILNFWVELGILGVFAFLGLIIQFFYFSFKMIRNWKLEIGNLSIKNNRVLIIGITFSILEVLIHGMVDVPYFKNDLSFLFWLLFAMMGVYWVESKKESDK